MGVCDSTEAQPNDVESVEQASGSGTSSDGIDRISLQGQLVEQPQPSTTAAAGQSPPTDAAAGPGQTAAENEQPQSPAPDAADASKTPLSPSEDEMVKLGTQLVEKGSIASPEYARMRQEQEPAEAEANQPAETAPAAEEISEEKTLKDGQLPVAKEMTEEDESLRAAAAQAIAKSRQEETLREAAEAAEAAAGDKEVQTDEDEP